MKKYLKVSGLAFFVLFAGHAAAQQETKGETLHRGELSVENLEFPVVSPTCAFDQLDIGQLFGIAFGRTPAANPRAGVAALILLTQQFPPEAVRLFLVGVLCEL